MSRTIRISEATHAELDELRDWKQSYDDVIRDLLRIRSALEKAAPIIEGQRSFLKGQLERKAKGEVSKVRE